MTTRLTVAGLLTACGTALGQVVYTAPDSVQVVQFLEDSVIEITDQNGDCLISDIDVIFMINERLIDQYGDTFDVGDLDGDNLSSTGFDVEVAIRMILSYGFGDADQDGIVTQQDVATIGQWVSNSQIEGDINLDGQIDVFDTADANSQINSTISNNVLNTMANRIFQGLSQLHSEGAEAFMSSECQVADHHKGISSTWPGNHPSWWPSNHHTGVSYSYPSTHRSDDSSEWPANHSYTVSEEWLLDTETGEYTWFEGWPAGHLKSMSDTWGDFVHPHDWWISRTWWPNHNKTQSNAQQVPPAHHSSASITGTHGSTQSMSKWPPNHINLVSNGWPGHQSHYSGTFPPNHAGPVSWEWPNPIFNWPSGHTVAISTTWGSPGPEEWPDHIPGHAWLTTFSEQRDIIDPPSPWPDPWPW